MLRLRGEDSSGDEKKGPKRAEEGYSVGVSKGVVKRTQRSRIINGSRKKEFKKGGL